jgi:uncharacterized alkaline shock family protein YloU
VSDGDEPATSPPAGRGTALDARAPSAPATGVSADERGVTAIADRVVEKIAARAVTESEGAGGAGRQVLGVPVSRADLDKQARVHADVDGDLVTLNVALSVAYPLAAREVCGAVRRHVVDRVNALTGLDVLQVDIDITRLVTEPARRKVR